MILRSLDQRAGVPWKARSTESRSGKKKLGADAVVQPDAARNFLDVDADFFGRVGDLVDERDLGSKKRIRCVFVESTAINTASASRTAPARLPAKFSR